MKRISDVVKSGKILVSDGAWGTFLQQKGLKPGECPEAWCLKNPLDVKDIAEKYFAAGSDMVQANSFGGSSFKLKQYGLEGQVAEINRAAATLSKEAAHGSPDEDAHWVIASIGPTGKMLVMGDVTEEELYESFKEQALALEAGGADAVCVETMTDIAEACLAVKAAKENTGCEVICTFTFDKTVQGDYKTMMGATPKDACGAAIEAGADIVGSNCGNGIDGMINIAAEIRSAFPDIPILIHANAGMPVLKDGKEFFPETPQDTAARVPALIEAGANIIGGCCGTTPEHIEAIKEVVGRIST